MKSQNWKQLPIDLDGIPSSELQFFGGIEELSDYDITQESCGVERSKRKKQQKKANTKKVKIQEDFETEKLNQNEIDMSAWNNFLLHDSLIRGLKELGFTTPTEIQAQVIPIAAKKNQDVLGAAETGSGKTLAFGLPIINKILFLKDQSKLNEETKEKKLYSLILTPTRELAIQVKKHLQAVSKYTDLLISVVVGGMSLEKQRRILKKGPDIIVATPGRLWELFEENEEHVSKIPEVKFLVIDEADRMVEKGHFAELTQILSLIKGNERSRRQTLVFSATLTLVHDPPSRIALKKKKKSKVQKKHHKIDSLIKLIGLTDPKVIDITKVSAMVATLTESQIMCSNEEKDIYLYYFLLMHPGRTLVFCNSKDSVRRLRTILEYLNCRPLPLHASMPQRQRLKNLDKFIENSSSVLLATDVAARGLDIKGIDNVIHFQVPRTSETYVHRSGRTARAETEGLSLILTDPQEIVYFKRICKTLNKKESLPKFPVDSKALKTVKQRIDLAHSIDKIEHRMNRMTAQNRWFLETAKEMEVDIEDENLLNDLGDKMELAAKCRKIKAMKKQLNMLLQKSLFSTVQTGNYPTKSGKLENSFKYAKQKAVFIAKKKK